MDRFTNCFGIAMIFQIRLIAGVEGKKQLNERMKGEEGSLRREDTLASNTLSHHLNLARKNHTKPTPKRWQHTSSCATSIAPVDTSIKRIYTKISNSDYILHPLTHILHIHIKLTHNNPSELASHHIHSYFSPLKPLRKPLPTKPNHHASPPPLQNLHKPTNPHPPNQHHALTPTRATLPRKLVRPHRHSMVSTRRHDLPRRKPRVDDRAPIPL
jgi:hypothetical protein